MPPITRREQLELDELLGDIYKNIETLPDKSRGGAPVVASYDIVRQDSRSTNKNNRSQQQQPRVIGQAHIREYELPESSPLVQRHRQELREGARATNSPKQQQRGRTSNLTGGNFHEEASQRTQSLATFLNANPVGSATPENKRRVRIVDPATSQGGVGGGRRSGLDYVDADDDDCASNDYQNESAILNYNNNNTSRKHRATPTAGVGNKEKVKYVNTNKFIYHQERNPDDEPLPENLSDEDILPDGRTLAGGRGGDDDDDDDDIDGVTRVEYYHTSWLDRQLGRASKRRSSKELNERQVKEKAMIEELKRSLKNGAITLRQSFKGKGKNRSPKSSDIFDDFDQQPQQRQYNNKISGASAQQHNKKSDHRIKDSPSKVIASGLATLPKHHRHHKQSSKHNNNKQQQQQQELVSNTLNYNQNSDRNYQANNSTISEPYSQFDTVYRGSNYDPYSVAPLLTGDQTTTTTTTTTSGSYTKPAPTSESMQQNHQCRGQQTSNYQPPANYSRTLPHKKAEQPHQLLQSHYRGTLRDKSNTLKLNSSPRPSPLPTVSRATPTAQQQQQPPPQQPSRQVSSATDHPNNSNKMRNTAYSSNNYNSMKTNTNNAACSPNPHGGAQSPIQQREQAATTISGMPSATEVVRSALSRSSSQVSLNQLNKTINLLPNSPPATSPMTPTQQLKPATPSLSPSPTSGFRSPGANQYSSKTLAHHQPASYPQHQQQQNQYLPGQVVLHGTRYGGTQSPKLQQQQQQQQEQPVYANPHASFMQHRMEQQMKQPNRNVASIREFNELDSLLRSLGPGGRGGPSSSVQTTITPGYSSKPSQPTFGGYMPSNQPQQQHAPTSNTPGDIYARVQRPQQQQQQQRPAGAGFAPAAAPSGPHQQGYTVDVTNKKYDENCQRQREELSEFETPIELVPSMEDYQNIAKLNPVKNHYWYKPNMSRDMAISLLKDKPQGTFIVRDSTSFTGGFGLAVKVAKLPKNILASLRNNNDPSAEFIRHFLIEPTGSGVRLKGYANEPAFDSLADLIYQHSLTELALPCKLIIPRADIEDTRFNQKQKQFFDEFIASKEQAKHQPYERTSPDGGYRRYPGDVYVHNEHRIIFE